MQATEHGLTYNIDWNNSTLIHSFLRGSATHLKQILQNIASNSIKYNKIGGSVTVSCQELFNEKYKKYSCF